MRIGALEAGGTKMVCAIGDENGKIYDFCSDNHTGRDHAEDHRVF